MELNFGLRVYILCIPRAALCTAATIVSWLPMTSPVVGQTKASHLAWDSEFKNEPHRSDTEQTIQPTPQHTPHARAGGLLVSGLPILFSRSNALWEKNPSSPMISPLPSRTFSPGGAGWWRGWCVLVVVVVAVVVVTLGKMILISCPPATTISNVAHQNNGWLG